MYDQLRRDPGLPVPNPTRSFWQQPGHDKLLGIKSKELPSRRNIVIIGSGMTACSVSKELLANDLSGTVTVLEAREVCSGATGRNGGRITCIAVRDFDKYRRLYGDEDAKKIVRFELGHYDEMAAAAQELGPELFKKTEVRQDETVATVFSDHKLQEFRDMHANFEAAFPDLAGRIKMLGNEIQEVYGLHGAKGGFLSKTGGVWAYRLVTSLFEKLLTEYGAAERFSIETNTPVLQTSRDQSSEYPYLLTTPRGSIHARHVVHCTEGHTAHLVPNLRGILVPRRGQMSVQNPGSAFRDQKGRRSYSFNYEHGFDYLSQNPHTGQIFIGGGELSGFDGGLSIHGISSDAEESIPAKSHLTGVLPVIFGRDGWGEEKPGTPTLHASWTGILCNSLDGAPMVGMLPQEALGSRRAGQRHAGAEWISAGYGGYGMVNAWRCGKAVAKQLLGKESPELPPPYRITPARMVKLSTRLAEIAGSGEHLRALL